jgi:cell division protein FtsZ
MLGRVTPAADTHATSIGIEGQPSWPADGETSAMAEGSLLIAGVGGLGCAWAKAAHQRCSGNVDVALIDADERSLEGARHAHCLVLGDEPSAEGCAALPALAQARMRALLPVTEHFLAQAELVVLLTGLGGGSGSGAAQEFARQAAQAGSLVITIAAMPFEAQSVRCQIAEEALARLTKVSHVCVELSLDRMAWQARERGVDWQQGSAWIEELVEGLMTTLSAVGLINLDLMDLRAIVSKSGSATLLVAEGNCDDALDLYNRARAAPMAALSVGGASGCLLQVEGGPNMTMRQVADVADAFTDGLSDDAQVIFGARVTPELGDRMRVVAVVSGLPRGSADGLH